MTVGEMRARIELLDAQIAGLQAERGDLRARLHRTLYRQKADEKRREREAEKARRVRNPPHWTDELKDRREQESA